jgi:F420-dependent oxidoreductase-like protein
MTTADDGHKLGVRWGFAGGVALSSVSQVSASAQDAVAAGFESFWISQSNAVDPVVALAAVADEVQALAEVGTSVVPLYGRHPLGVGQMVRTAQSALDGRLTLGIGPSHRAPVTETLGMAWDRPLSYTREFLDGLVPLLAGEQVNAEGEQLVTRAELNVDAPGTPILLAALGPRMLALAGARTAGTTVGQCGPTTIRTHIAPLISDAAAKAGRPSPRIMALIRLCVTDNPGPAYALAKEIGAFYAALPSYAAVLAKEGLTEPADLHLIGSWEHVLDGLGRYAEAGVTDFRLEIVAPGGAEYSNTLAAFAHYLT